VSHITVDIPAMKGTKLTMVVVYRKGPMVLMANNTS